jgi:hypothetical protein
MFANHVAAAQKLGSHSLAVIVRFAHRRCIWKGGAKSAMQAKTRAPRPRIYTPYEVAEHCTPDDCWVTLRGAVLDLTELLKVRSVAHRYTVVNTKLSVDTHRFHVEPLGYACCLLCSRTVTQSSDYKRVGCAMRISGLQIGSGMAPDLCRKMKVRWRSPYYGKPAQTYRIGERTPLLAEECTH